MRALFIKSQTQLVLAFLTGLAALTTVLLNSGFKPFFLEPHLFGGRMLEFLGYLLTFGAFGLLAGIENSIRDQGDYLYHRPITLSGIYWRQTLWYLSIAVGWIVIPIVVLWLIGTGPGASDLQN